MEDFERYGDYDGRDYEEHHKSGWFALILKICIFALCIGVVGILVFRMVIFKNYPQTMKSIYFTEALTEHYNENGGNVSARTQKLRAPYDNPKFSNFMCDYLIVTDKTDELQITLRYNDSMIKEAEEKYSLTGLLAGDESLLSFRLVDNLGNVYEKIAYKAYESEYMYNYVKLVFEDVDLDKNEQNPSWVRLEVFINAAKSEEPFAMIAIYENHEDYNVFEEYVLSDKERPKK